MTKRDKTRRKGDSSGKALRDEHIRAMAASGKKTTEIAEEMGIARQQVSKILNSDETKQAVQAAKGRIAAMIDDALETLHHAILAKYDDLPTALKAAMSVLKNHGAITEKVEMDHTVKLKPFIIEKRDGSEIVLGIEQRKDEE